MQRLRGTERSYKEAFNNDKKLHKISLAFYAGTTYNGSAKWYEVEGNGDISLRIGGDGQ